MISTAYAGVLAAGRDIYNARMREARRRYPMLSHDAFFAFLETAGAPVDAVAAVAPERLPAVVDSIYDIGLELAGRTLVGPAARTQVLTVAWRTVLPHFARLIAAEPAQVLGMLSNAVVHLEAIEGTRVTQWMDELASLAPHIGSVGALRSAGQIAAWRAGAAHFRAGALAAAAGLPESLALAALRAAPGASIAALLRQMTNDPWWQGSDTHACQGREVGAFVGFGGQFGAPPDVRPSGEGFLVRASGRAFYLMADAYGASLQPATIDAFDGADIAQLPRAVVGGELAVDGMRLQLDLPEDGLRVCANDATIAITSPFTHAIRLVARQ